MTGKIAPPASDAQTTTAGRRRYLPAAGCNWLLPIYDPQSGLFRGDSVRATLLDQMVLAPGQRVLGNGCATGTLVVLLKQVHAGISVIGLDSARMRGQLTRIRTASRETADSTKGVVTWQMQANRKAMEALKRASCGVGAM